jgi:hypothetical protein
MKASPMAECSAELRVAPMAQNLKADWMVPHLVLHSDDELVSPKAESRVGQKAAGMAVSSDY